MHPISAGGRPGNFIRVGQASRPECRWRAAASALRIPTSTEATSPHALYLPVRCNVRVWVRQLGRVDAALLHPSCDAAASAKLADAAVADCPAHKPHYKGSARSPPSKVGNEHSTIELLQQHSASSHQDGSACCLESSWPVEFQEHSNFGEAVFNQPWNVRSRKEGQNSSLLPSGTRPSALVGKHGPESRLDRDCLFDG